MGPINFGERIALNQSWSPFKNTSTFYLHKCLYNPPGSSLYFSQQPLFAKPLTLAN
jgi:hypothetical protein